MAFSDFKAIPDVQEKFRITYTTDTQNRTSFSIDNLPVLFGAINAVFKAASQASVGQS